MADKAMTQKTIGRVLLAYAAAIPIAALITGCGGIAVAPGAELVQVAKSPSEVQGCRVAGQVTAPWDGIHSTIPQLKNMAIVFGGDTIYLTQSAGFGVKQSVAIAYNCGHQRGGIRTPGTPQPDQK